MWGIQRSRGVRRRRRRAPSKQYLTHKEAARTVIHERVAYFASLHGFSYGRIAIRDTKRSWGSCSTLGNLNFNYRLLFLPPHLRDYVIVHELCHLRVFNHSEEFWNEVTAILLEVTEHRRELRALEKTGKLRPIIAKSPSLTHNSQVDRKW